MPHAPVLAEGMPCGVHHRIAIPGDDHDRQGELAVSLPYRRGIEGHEGGIFRRGAELRGPKRQCCREHRAKPARDIMGGEDLPEQGLRHEPA
jgi:hypothetical protein